MTSRDFGQIGGMVFAASAVLMAFGILLPGDVGRALLYTSILALVAATALLIVGILGRR